MTFANRISSNSHRGEASCSIQGQLPAQVSRVSIRGWGLRPTDAVRLTRGDCAAPTPIADFYLGCFAGCTQINSTALPVSVRNGNSTAAWVLKNKSFEKKRTPSGQLRVRFGS